MALMMIICVKCLMAVDEVEIAWRDYDLKPICENCNEQETL
jgi:hypothetical protein